MVLALEEKTKTVSVNLYHLIQINVSEEVEVTETRGYPADVRGGGGCWVWALRRGSSPTLPFKVRLPSFLTHHRQNFPFKKLVVVLLRDPASLQAVAHDTVGDSIDWLIDQIQLIGWRLSVVPLHVAVQAEQHWLLRHINIFIFHMIVSCYSPINVTESEKTQLHTRVALNTFNTGLYPSDLLVLCTWSWSFGGSGSFCKYPPNKRVSNVTPIGLLSIEQATC